MKIVADQNIPFVKECFSSLGEVVLVSGRQITPALIRDADALLVRSITKVDKDLLAGSSVQFVATATIGFEHVDRDYLTANGIGFASAPGSNANSVAEYITAALLALGRKYKFRLEGKSIGIVGVGNVGSRVEKKCRALGMKAVLNDPPLARQTGDAKYRPLEELFDCDFITLHTPLTKEGPDKTYHLADERFFASLKNGAVFLNTSRGKVHDEAALKSAMKAGRLRAVVLDVWETEPNVDSWLLRYVDISTPHIAGYSFDGKVVGMLMVYEALCRHFGLKTVHTAAEFLPAPAVPEIRITEQQDSEQIIHHTVQQVYAIHRDDFNMREILLQPKEQRGVFFDNLRKNYPIRREFQNTAVLLADTQSPLARKLEGIGFRTGVLR
ncbi:MAG: 4-phosphoerythronate dehydrogenase PdxB [Phycisphaerae bacterium]|nr:4-phosphoerythronate dehydrogenase PdxB [Phycisphaerae bacterium]